MSTGYYEIINSYTSKDTTKKKERQSTGWAKNIPSAWYGESHTQYM